VDATKDDPNHTIQSSPTTPTPTPTSSFAIHTLPIWKWDYPQVSQFIIHQSNLNLNLNQPAPAPAAVQQQEEVYRTSLNTALANVCQGLNNNNNKNNNKNTCCESVQDVFHLCPKATLEAAWNLPAGALFVKLQLGGIVNGVSGVVGGVTESYVTNLADCKRMWKESKDVSSEENVRRFKCLGEGWYDYANRLKAAMNAKVGEDKINEMPMQIVDMMCGKGECVLDWSVLGGWNMFSWFCCIRNRYGSCRSTKLTNKSSPDGDYGAGYKRFYEIK